MSSGVLKQFCETSSVKGLARAVKTRRMPLRVLWCAAVLVGGFTAGYMLTYMFRDYFSKPVRTVIESVQKATVFPDVTVCNLQAMNSRNVKEAREAINHQREEELFVEHLQSISSAGHARDDLILGCTWTDKKEAGVVECSDENFMQVSDPNYFNCYTVHYTNGTMNSEDVYQLIMILYIDDFFDVIYKPKQFTGYEHMEKGVIVVVHDAGTYPDMTEGIYLSPGASVRVDLERHERILDPEIGSACTEEKYVDQSKWFNETTGSSSYSTDDPEAEIPSSEKYIQRYSYSKTGCNLYCMQEKTIEKCGCISHKFPGAAYLHDKYNFCGSKEFFGTFPEGEKKKNNLKSPKRLDDLCTPNSTQCSCVPSCRELSFSYSIHQTAWPHHAYHLGIHRNIISHLKNDIARHFNVYGDIADNVKTNMSLAMEQLRETDLIRRNFLQVYIRLKNDFVTVTIDKLAFTFENFIGSVGGILNLWIGISFVTLFELFELCYGLFRRSQNINVIHVGPALEEDKN